MLISPKEINKILSVTGSESSIKGKKYFEQSRVKIADFNYTSDSSYLAKTYVQGTMIYEVELEKKDNCLSFKCDCKVASKRSTPCKHVIASIFDIYIYPEKYMEFFYGLQKKEFDTNVVSGKSYKDVMNELYQNCGIVSYYENYENYDLLKNITNVTITPNLCIDQLDTFSKDKKLLVNFKIGKDKLYTIKDLVEFSKNVLNKNNFKYGKNLEFIHCIEAFDDDSKRVVDYICKYGMNYLGLNEIATTSFSIGKRYKSFIPLNNFLLDEFFDIYKDKKVLFEGERFITFVAGDPDTRFSVTESENGDSLEIVNENSDFSVFDGGSTIYILCLDNLYRCSGEYSKKVGPLLKAFRSKKSDRLIVDKKSASSFCEYLVPNVSSMANLNISNEILEKYKPQELAVKVYLDIDDMSNIVANVKFCYGDVEFNPFSDVSKLNCNRNLNKEAKIKKLFSDCHFVINTKKEILTLNSEDDIYEFLTNGINLFMQKFEVLVTDKLKNKQIINNKAINVGVRIKNDLLEVNIDDLELDEYALNQILKRYKQKKKYYRLKDGTFLNLENSGINTLNNLSENLGVSVSSIVDGSFNLPKYRSIYLDTLLKESSNINIQKDNSFLEVVNEIKDSTSLSYKVPDILNDTLRNYQKIGFNWLKMLDKYNFGGILADDMGLGKTIQIIAILIDEKIKAKESGINLASIVVCPSSLYINWEREIKRFAPDINILVVAGSAKSREDLINDISKVDVVLTSYDLLKRDIEFYEKYNFKYAIADEAQYIKNNNTKNAKALKRIKASTRFALTGTPIENSLSELWSIFDFCMPGYLFSYKKFRENYEMPIIKDEDESTMKKLQKLVVPFVLRRMKKDVLTELPDKTETVMYSKMDNTQQELYNAYLIKAKREMEEEIETNGFEKSRMKVLSMITRLRQICCHPSLFIEDYTGESSKLTQCIQLIEDAISCGHKILLFSGFTSMFDIIIKELERRGILYYMLTGKTKVDTRIQMVEDFNKKSEIKVFLISLKAGGTGLNLTGADMVIHFDPWWNLSAENQATDRAYRIGQRNNVQVFKLISQDTIEEKIINLQNKKKELTNSVISENTTFINNMSKEEIMELFKI